MESKQVNIESIPKITQNTRRAFRQTMIAVKFSM